MITLVIADDHPVVREGLAAILSTQPDFQVLGEAGDGAGLVELAITLHPDVALVDLAMPGVDGVEAIRRMSAAAPGVRALVLTAFDTDERIISALAAGAAGYLLKGAPRAEIFSAIRTVGADGSLLQPAVATRLVDRIARPQPPTLSPRALEVLRLLALGRANKEIAASLGITERTVKFHVSAILQQLGASNRTEALSRAAQLGIIEL